MSKLDLQTLEQSRIALENAITNPQIAASLNEVGYGKAKLQEGKALLKKAQTAYDANKKEDVEASLAYTRFDGKKKELENEYRAHRKRAKVIFEDNPDILLRLDIHRATPTTYLSWMDSIKQFYTEATTDEAIKTALKTLKVKEDDLLVALGMIPQIEELRKAYLNEKGESQDATKVKDTALKDLDKWMRTFFSIASIALEDNPQLMESLSKLVKS